MKQGEREQKILEKKLELAELSIILAQITKDKNGKLDEATILMTEINRLLKDIGSKSLELEELQNT